VGITAGSKEIPGRNACDRRHKYCIIIIIIIIIIINCNWVVIRWHWLFYMYTKHEIGY